MMCPMNQKVLTFAKRQDESARVACQGLGQWLKSIGCEIVDVTGKEDKITVAAIQGVSVGVVFGGDGSFLTLVRRLEKKDLFPLMGVNLGSLGFITEVGPDEVKGAMESFLEGKFSEELRPLVQVEVFRDKHCLISDLVLNDAVINKDAKTSLISMEVKIDGDLLSQTRADGYIIGTPTGSTGYSLSNEGALLHPAVKAMILRPICAHALAVRSVVIPQNMSVEIEVKNVLGPAYMICDGQIQTDIIKGDRVRVRVSETSLRVILSDNQTWPDILRAKLNMH